MLSNGSHPHGTAQPGTTAPAPNRTSGNWALLFATMFPQTIMSLVVMTPPVVADRVIAAVHLPAEATGLYATLNYSFIAVGTLCSASLIGRLGPLRLSFACIAVGGFTMALFGMASLASVLIATACMGLCYGPLTPASQQAIAGQGPIPNLALFLSIRQTAVPLGGVLAGLLIPPLVVAFGLTTAMLIAGAAITLGALATGTALVIVRKEAPPQHVPRAPGLFAPLRLILSARHLLGLCFASTIYGAMQLIVSSLLVVFLMAELGRDLILAGIMLGVSQGAAVIGRIGWGFIADRFNALRLTLGIIGLIMALACILTGLLTPATPNWVIGVVVFVLGGTASGWNGVFLANLMREVEPAQAGFAASGALLFSYLGIVLGPPLFGALALLIGFSNAFLALSLVALGGSALCWSPGR
jgi:MFS family permease